MLLAMEKFYSADVRGEYSAGPPGYDDFKGEVCGKVSYNWAGIGSSEYCVYLRCKPNDKCARTSDIGIDCYEAGVGAVDMENGICCDINGDDDILGTADDNVVTNGHCCPKDYPYYDSQVSV